MGDVPGLDLAGVTRWLAGHHPGLLDGPVTATLLAGGRSNLTYLLDDGTRRVVLRRPPLGHVLATAHDMAREYRMISALAGTPVPVPRALARCEDPAVTGAPFYLMSHVEGRVLRERADLADLDAAARVRVTRSMTDVLADLHAVDPDAVGLAGSARPDGFMARQVRRWATQLDASRSRDLPGADELRDELAARVPPPSTGPGGGIVHGDYRLDNLVVAGPGEPDALAVRAVLDWEMATVGEPLADLGLLLAYWDGLGAMPDPAPADPAGGDPAPGGRGPVVAALGPGAGLPAGDVVAGWYAERTGTDLSALPWYVAFGFFKIAVILEGIHYRYTLGRTVGEGFEHLGPLVPGLIAAGRERLRTAAGR